MTATRGAAPLTGAPLNRPDRKKGRNVKVQITRAVAFRGKKYEAGQTVNLAKADAEHLIGIHFASAAEPAKKASAKVRDADAK